MEFKEYSENVVKNFLGSVAFIDDKIFTKEQTKSSDPTTVITPSRATSPKQNKLPSTTNTSSIEAITKTAEQDLEIDPKEFMDVFTNEGIHCSLCEYNKESTQAYKNILLKSDVAILDWNMNSGENEGTEACEFIEYMIKTDKELSLRLIVIYTSTPKQQWSDNIIENTIKPLFGNAKTIITDNSISSGHTKIVFIHKGNPNTLPARIIEEFAEMTSGLVSNTALNAVTVIRENTNKLLGVFHKDLDPAYLSNRALLANKKSDVLPESSEDLLKEMIMSSILNLVQSSHLSKSCGEECISKWMDSIQDFKGKDIKVNGKVLKISNSDRKEWLKDGSEKITEIIIQRSGASGQLGKAEKNIMLTDPINYFTPEHNNSKNLNEEFAVLSHQNKNFLGDKFIPILSLGCVLKYKSESPSKDNYLLCIQQPCDSSRLSSDEERSFIFLELENSKPKKTKIIVKADENSYIKLEPKLNSHYLRTYIFKENKDGFVQANNQEFVSKCGTRFKWFCDLKSNHAQRIVNEFSAALARVGLDESEFLRLS
ncbi:MAG: hypothetical protein HXX14_16900 [Bacteroidetes bacterium]|nr:hypothetical protein [Bacteroidota bacterium]